MPAQKLLILLAVVIFAAAITVAVGLFVASVVDIPAGGAAILMVLAPAIYLFWRLRGGGIKPDDDS